MHFLAGANQRRELLLRTAASLPQQISEDKLLYWCCEAVLLMVLNLVILPIYENEHGMSLLVTLSCLHES
jgi:hypothetical protein